MDTPKTNILAHPLELDQYIKDTGWVQFQIYNPPSPVGCAKPRKPVWHSTTQRPRRTQPQIKQTPKYCWHTGARKGGNRASIKAGEKWARSISGLSITLVPWKPCVTSGDLTRLPSWTPGFGQLCFWKSGPFRNKSLFHLLRSQFSLLVLCSSIFGFRKNGEVSKWRAVPSQLFRWWRIILPRQQFLFSFLWWSHAVLLEKTPYLGRSSSSFLR